MAGKHSGHTSVRTNGGGIPMRAGEPTVASMLKPWPLPARRYAAMVSMVDRNVGEIIALLKELGLDQDTIVFFCGDNGGMDYFASKDHRRGFHAPNVNPKTGQAFCGQKGRLYEGGLRIPMVVRWPGHIAPGRVSDFPLVFSRRAAHRGRTRPRVPAAGH